VWDDAGRPAVDGMKVVGVDPARTGIDKTIIAVRYGPLISELRPTALEDTMQTAGRVRGVLDSLGKGAVAVVDVIGIGAGVVDRLREQKFHTIGFNAGASTKRKDAAGELGFLNARSAAWWNIRELLDPANGHGLMLPPDDRMIGDLTAPHWQVMSGGKIKVESKDDIRKRIGRSTDHGDAIIHAFWPRHAGWADAYGMRYCEHCKQPYLFELHPGRCPHCRREQNMDD
jgi:hypothetical protein